jgi:hypothetical protein
MGGLSSSDHASLEEHLRRHGLDRGADIPLPDGSDAGLLEPLPATAQLPQHAGDTWRKTGARERIISWRQLVEAHWTAATASTSVSSTSMATVRRAADARRSRTHNRTLGPVPTEAQTGLTLRLTRRRPLMEDRCSAHRF